ncbi:hypothetical protein NDU88_000105 [Pleurodeles waltl]|uniref:Uncharacterized protein n=1 Tax=Pleurodeles waltl TaxID=8319 RepID=A0AAV7TE28_PLEWA|nr:hypothetical protein NDU88_000105 [Pleurodeles waltl]
MAASSGSVGEPRRKVAAVTAHHNTTSDPSRCCVVVCPRAAAREEAAWGWAEVRRWRATLSECHAWRRSSDCCEAQRGMLCDWPAAYPGVRCGVP